MSATPRIYELEDSDESYDIEIIYNMNFTDAINNKYITDYKIWLPSIHEDNEKLNNELSVYDIDNIIKSKCNYLFSCLLNNGSRKCIIYCINNEELNYLIEGFNELNKFYYLEYEINKINSRTTFNDRQKILNNFENNNKIQLLFSIRILDECIDIPTCDSIYITYPSQSKIRTIQRLSRCIRIDKNNKFKIGNIYIWCNEYDKILDTLSGIKEYDVFFKDKISLNETNFYNKKEKLEFNNDKKLIEKYILGIKEFKQYTWNEKLELVKKYINENKCRPLMKDNNIKNKWKQFIDEYFN
jgi:superfamily II DNA or RNA helicase